MDSFIQTKILQNKILPDFLLMESNLRFDIEAVS